MDETPKRHSRIKAAEDDAQILIDILKECDGDVDLFARQFNATTHESKLKCLQKTLMILSKSENAGLKLDWDENIAAYKQAKLLLAQRTAFNWIGEYQPPKGTKKEPVTIPQASSYIGLWTKEYTAGESVKGRKAANEVPEGKTNMAAAETMRQLKEKVNESRTNDSERDSQIDGGV